MDYKYMYFWKVENEILLMEIVVIVISLYLLIEIYFVCFFKIFYSIG